MEEKFIVLDETYLPQMAELYKVAFGCEPWNDDWSDENQLKEYVKEISCSFNSLNYGLLINGRLSAVSIGMIRHWWEGTNYNIEEFCVSPDLQGQNIGSRFMGMIEEDIKSRGLSGIFLQTDNDKPAYRFYIKNGFNELNSHVSFYKRVKK
jgi:aminoglycoside 6'-N-acetyltransferase I